MVACILKARLGFIKYLVISDTGFSTNSEAELLSRGTRCELSHSIFIVVGTAALRLSRIEIVRTLASRLTKGRWRPATSERLPT